MQEFNNFSPFASQNHETFVFSDIHGCAKEFDELLRQLPLRKNSRLVFLGDYIDRGPDSAKVIDRILELSKSFAVTTLMGNHEKMFLDYLDSSDSDESSLFSINGGTATLASYNPDNNGYKIPELHLQFYRQLKYYHVDEHYLYVHAGLPDVAINDLEQYPTPIEFLWLRDKFYNSTFEWDKVIIHGHTPVMQCFVSAKRINIDTGCVFGNKLTAIELPRQKIYEIAKVKAPKEIYYKIDGSARRSERLKVCLPVALHTTEGVFKCKAIDYSATGTMLMFDDLDRVYKCNLEKIVKGYIGIKGKDVVAFEGVVKRSLKNAQAIFYGIEFSSPPTVLSYEEAVES